MPDSVLQQVLLQLLAEVQHLRVDLAGARARLNHGASGHEILEAQIAERNRVVQDHEDLVAKIRNLS